MRCDLRKCEYSRYGVHDDNVVVVSFLVHRPDFDYLLVPCCKLQVLDPPMIEVGKFVLFEVDCWIKGVGSACRGACSESCCCGFQ